MTSLMGWLDEAAEARALGQDTLERSRRVLGPDHLVTLGTAMVLTLVLPRSAEAEQARILGQDTLERSRRVLGADHPITLRAGTALAAALGWLGEVQQARRLGQDIVERYRRILGPDHPHTLRLAQVVDSSTAEQEQHQTDLLWLLRPQMTATPNEDQVQR
jgi:hypothetical protein